MNTPIIKVAWSRLAVAGLLAAVAGLAKAQFESGPAPVAPAQSESTPAQLTGTMQKVRDSGTITIGHRQASVPLSYVSPRGEPVGYSIDLCKLLVEAISEQVGRGLEIKWLLVTPESRIAAITSGQADLECGSTTNNLERQKQVGFSPTIFVSGTKLMVKKGSPIRSFRDLAGKKVVVTAGTTNEKALRDLMQKFKLDFTLLTTPDHAASFAMLTGGQADTFATDDVLLYGLIAQHNVQGDYMVVGEFLSYDPYGIMYRKGDAQLAKLVNDTFHLLAADREIERRYTRWFLRKLPGSTVSLDLPMSPHLEGIVQMLALPAR